MDIDINILQSSFGIRYLRPYQELIIRTILESYENGEKKDLLGILPTGSGKSRVCYHRSRWVCLKKFNSLLSVLALTGRGFHRWY